MRLKQISKRVYSVGCVVFASLLCSFSASSQTTVGIQPFGSYQGSLDHINLADLGIHIDIPLFVHKSRGAYNGISVHLIYDSSYYSPNNGEPDYGWRVVAASAGGGGSIYSDYKTEPCPPGGNGTYQVWTYYFIDATGYRHPFSGTSNYNVSCNNVTNTTLRTYAADGSGYYLSAGSGPSATVVDRSGTQYGSTASGYPIVDANGNGAYPASLKDTSNVSVTVTGGLYITDQYGVPSSRTPTVIQYTDSNGSTQQITIAYKLYNYGNTGGYGLVDSVTFPDGSSYHFTYQSSAYSIGQCSGDNSGYLASLQLPTGGTISYQNTFSQPCSDCPTETLTRTTSDGTTTYSNTGPVSTYCGTHTTSTTIAYPDGSSEKMTSLLANASSYLMLETAHYWYTSSNVQLKSTMRCYNGASGDCTSTAVTFPITQISTTTTLDGGLSTSKTVELLNGYGLEKELDEYDYGATAATRKTLTSYASLDNNIVDHPQQVTVYDGSGNVASQTTYSYDEYSPLEPAPSGVSGLAQITGSRGNLTSVSRWTSGSKAVTTHTHYDTAGVAAYTLDGNSNKTTYDRDSTDSYITKVTYPTVPAGTFADSYTVDSNTGLVTKWTDRNSSSNVTTYTYDSMLRKTGTCNPDGGYTKISYTPTTVTTSVLVTGACAPGGGVPSGTWATSSVQSDAYGRTSHRTDWSGYITDIGFDSMGREYSVSNPHASGAAASGTAYSYYDALGRKTKEIAQDQATSYWCYNGDQTAGQPNCKPRACAAGSWVNFQDANGNQWERTSDALGRLTCVREPNGSSQSASMETDYGYDALDDLVSVNQAGDGSGARARSFAYDGASRLLASSNPEDASPGVPGRLTCQDTSGSTWTHCYTYDGNGNVLTAEDNRQITVTSTYDAWNRVAQKSYSSASGGSVPPTLEKFGYDGDDENGQAIPNQASSLGRVGHLSRANNGVNAASYYYYDAMGRAIQKSSCIPGDCTYDVNVNAAYYPWGGLKTLTNGSPQKLVTYTYNRDTTLQLQSVTSSGMPSDCSHPTTLFSAVAYGPVGLTSGKLAVPNSGCSSNQITETRGYDSRNRVSSDSFGGSAVEATPPQGTISIAGSAQSKVVNQKAGTGWVAINGSEQSTTIQVGCGPYGQMCPYTIYDGGNIQVTVNGFSESAGYGSGSTGAAIATALANAFNTASASPVNASASSNIVTFTAKTTGASTNYPLSAAVTGWNSSYFSSPSFSPSPSGSTLTGGSDGTATYDTGTITATVNGVAASTNWGQGDTSSAVASRLTAAINAAMTAFLTASPDPSSSSVIDLTSKNTQYWPISATSSGTNPNFPSPSITASPSGMNPAGYKNVPIYSYTVGYDNVGNVTAPSDLVMGNWNYHYDTLNRLSWGQASSGQFNGRYGCWTYDGFGDLKSAADDATSACASSPSLTFSASYYSSNQIYTSTTPATGPVTFQYDEAGHVTYDGTNSYIYDGASRLCAVRGPQPISGGPQPITQYIYDAEGNRVAKGSNSSFSCDPSTFTWTNSYSVGLNGEQLTENVSGSNRWDHSNIFLNGTLLATYHDSETYFAMNDWLGTKRAVSGTQGCLSTWISFPFGDGQSMSGNCQDVTEHHFTGKEHDTESGNDYFTARYYNSVAGRFISPDWNGPDPVPFADFADPQSLNLYAYASNNPLSYSDSGGHFRCDPSSFTYDPQQAAYVLKEGACHLELSDVEDYLKLQFQPVIDAASRAADFASQAAHQVQNVMNTPGGARCLGTLTWSGAGVGAAGGALATDWAFAGGPVVGGATTGGAALIGSVGGGASGFATGMSFCPGGAAFSGGGGTRGSTGRTTPNSSKEAEAMAEVRADPSKGTDLSKKGLKMTDPRWPASDGWVKMARNVDGVEVHWVRNTITGEVDDFKFK